MEVVVPANQGTPLSLSSFDASYGFALGNELLGGMPLPSEPPAEVRPWFGYIHTLEIYDRALSEDEIRVFLSEKPETPFQCPEPSSEDTPWDVVFCNATGETDADGRYCEYFVHSGSEELGTGPNCDAFCQAIGMRTCDLNEVCCWNNVENGDQCEHGARLECIREEGYQSQICRCFEVSTTSDERLDRQPGSAP